MNIYLTYRHKLTLLGVCFLLLVTLLWVRAIAPTIQIYNQCNDLESQLEVIEQSGGQIDELRAEIDYLDQLIGTGDYDSITLEQHLIGLIGSSDEQSPLIITNYSKPHVIGQGDYLRVTNQLELEGHFAPIIDAVRHIERSAESAQVCSLHLETRYDRINKQDKLYGNVYIRSLKKS